ncbi:MAG: heparan N-sulfatase, partial [Candidatus Omnitrophota bacterium]
IRKDPGCLVNLAANNEYEKIKNDLKNALESVLKEQGDPRQMRNGEIFDSYPRFGAMRPELGGFAEPGKYNPAFQK